MNKDYFIPMHINASTEDLSGNNGIGRYVLLPGSEERAQQIADNFNHLQVKKHPRGHNLYLGTLEYEGKGIDVAAVSSGMGCASIEIILHELFSLGGKRFLRVGTAGSLQSSSVKLGDLVNVQASVRDESTTINYAPIEFPAIAAVDYVSAILQSGKKLGLSDKLHTGIVHCKNSLYAREFGVGPKQAENEAYIDLLTRCGVLASEMETAALFIQSQIYNYHLSLQGVGPQYRVLAGAILGIISVHNEVAPKTPPTETMTEAIKLALETIKKLTTL
jgi:uridine phosphorylase